MRTMSLAACTFTLLFTLAGCDDDAGPTQSEAGSIADLAAGPAPDLAAATNPSEDLAISPPSDLAIGPDLAGPYVPIDGGPNVRIVEVVSPALCQSQNGHLRNCQAAAVTLDAPASMAPAPLHTDVQLKFTGNCSSQFPIARILQADAEPSAFFDSLFPKQQLSLRRLDRGPIAKLVITDAYPTWTSLANYDQSCRSWLEITFNLAD